MHFIRPWLVALLAAVLVACTPNQGATVQPQFDKTVDAAFGKVLADHQPVTLAEVVTEAWDTVVVVPEGTPTETLRRDYHVTAFSEQFFTRDTHLVIFLSGDTPVRLSMIPFGSIWRDSYLKKFSRSAQIVPDARAGWVSLAG